MDALDALAVAAGNGIEESIPLLSREKHKESCFTKIELNYSAKTDN